jgi:hypothetical protein
LYTVDVIVTEGLRSSNVSRVTSQFGQENLQKRRHEQFVLGSISMHFMTQTCTPAVLSSQEKAHGVLDNPKEL